MMMRAPSPTGRHGLSLLEVLTAMTIFLFALIVIGRLVVFGGDRAVDVQQQAQAAQLCQAKLAEVIAGATPLSAQTEVSFDEDPEWTWTLECEQQGSIPGLWSVNVRVTRYRTDGSRTECSLSQMVLDPTSRGSTQDAASAASATSTDAAATDTGAAAPSTPSTSPSQPAPASSTPAQPSPAPASPAPSTDSNRSSTPTTPSTPSKSSPSKGG